MRIASIVACFTLALVGAATTAVAQTEHHFTSVNVEYEGTRIWLPATFTVKKGDKVQIHLINNVPSEPDHHGFAIPHFQIAEVVHRGKPTTVSFTADKAGIFPVQCHLHPAHVGGQLIVLE